MIAKTHPPPLSYQIKNIAALKVRFFFKFKISLIVTKGKLFQLYLTKIIIFIQFFSFGSLCYFFFFYLFFNNCGKELKMIKIFVVVSIVHWIFHLNPLSFNFYEMTTSNWKFVAYQLSYILNQRPSLVERTGHKAIQSMLNR